MLTKNRESNVFCFFFLLVLKYITTIDLNAGLWIRIRIHFTSWIRIQEGNFFK